MPDVSVLIPVFNGADTVERAIDSARTGHGRSVEVIVVDDVSTDHTRAQVARIAARDDRVRLLARAENGGPAAARNAGLGEATGDFVAVLDADDAFLPGRLDRMLAAAGGGGADVVSDDLLLVEEATGRRLGAMFGDEPLPERLDAAGYVRGNLPDPQRPRRGTGFLKPVVDRRFLARNGLSWPAEMRFAEDYAFALSLLLAGARWRTVPEPSYLYAVRDSSLTASHGADDLARLCAVDRTALARADLDPPTRRALRRHLVASRKRAGWARFIDDFKARRPVAAARTLSAGPAVCGHIAGHLMVEAVRRSGRRLGLTRRRARQ